MRRVSRLLPLLLPALLASADPQSVAEDVRRLGSASYQEREAAQKALLAAGEPAVAEVEKALQDPDPEIRDRATTILKRLCWYRQVVTEQGAADLLQAPLEGGIDSNADPALRTLAGLARHLTMATGVPFVVQEGADADSQEISFSMKRGAWRQVLAPHLSRSHLHLKAVPGGVFVSPKPDPTLADMVPTLLKRLESSEEADRLGAALLLLGLTGERRGYDPYAAPGGNAGALKAWQDWWAAGRERIEADSRVAELRGFQAALEEGIASLKANPPSLNLEYLPGALASALGEGNERNRKLGDMARSLCPDLARPRLLALLVEDGKEEGRTGGRLYAIALAASLGLKEAVKPLLDLLKSRDPATVRLAGLALAEMGAEEAVAPLEGLLKDGPDEGKLTAAYALSRLGRKEGLAFLAGRLDSPSPVQAKQALFCLNVLVEGVTIYQAEGWKAWWEKGGEGVSWDAQARKFKAAAK